MFLDDLEGKRYAHAPDKSLPICIIQEDKKCHSILIEMKIIFSHVIPFYPMNGNHTAINPK